MTYKGARGAVPTRGRGDEYACGIDSDWPGSGGGQYICGTFLTRRAGWESEGGCESNWGSVMSYRHKFINFVVGKPGGENRVSENKTLTSWKLEQIRNLLSH